MQPTAALTPIQLTLLNLVTGGYSIMQAAREAAQETAKATATETSLSWGIIMEWSRTIPEFRLALDGAMECRAQLNRERAQELLGEALQVLVGLLSDEKASPSIRLRASLAIIKTATTPNTEAKRKSEIGENFEKVHKAAQSQPVRLPVEPGRNTICPCGSGAKFKRCCGNPVAAILTTAAVAASIAA
jgi:SEC-C motif